jgi:hypothetical protein
LFFKFDHLVHFTKNPELAVQKMADLGVHAVKGGHHESWGTYNSLCHFGLPYIEFLGLENLFVAKKVTSNTLISQVVDEHKQGDGFFRIALRTNNIEEAAHHFTSLGLKVIGPVEGERRREDGTLLKWAMMFIEDPDSEDPYKYPFIIDWKVTDEARAYSLMELGLITSEVQTKIKEIGIGTRDPLMTMEDWSRLFQLTCHSDKTGALSSDHPSGRRIARLGETAFVFHSTESAVTRPTFLRLAPTPNEGKMEIMGGTYLFNS